MRFENSTPFPAFLHREAIAGDRIAAAAIVRATYDIDTPCRASQQQPWLVSPIPWAGPMGPMEADAFFDREGCDLLLLGEAASADGSQVEALDVSLTVGDFKASLRVFGDRVWVRAGAELAPGTPAPFASMPLDLSHAYGGAAQFDELSVACPENPRGRGFYVEESEAEGGRLPNIEDPDQPMSRWTDRPEPVGAGFCPIGFPPRVRRALVVRGDRVVQIRRGIHNVAFPRFICPAVARGARVLLKGMGPALELELPSDEIVATTRVGRAEYQDVARIDQVGFEPALRRLFVTYRFTFVYPLRRGDLRRCELQWRRPGDASLPSSLHIATSEGT